MEEISLREYIEVLIKRKKTIIGITTASIIITAIISFFILDPVYETRMVLMASNFSERLQSNQLKGEGIDNILNSLSQYPNMTMETYRQQVKAPRVVRETIQELQLQDQYDIETLSQKLELETIRDTNLITIKMQSKDPVQASDIVNTIGKKFVAFVSDKAKEQATTTSSYIESQIEIEKEKLGEALLELKEFLAQPQGVLEISKELDARLIQVTDYKTQLTDMELNQQVRIKSIDATIRELNATEAKLKTKKSILEDSLLTNIAKEQTNGTINSIASITVENEEINPTYLVLKEKLSSAKIALTEIEYTIQNLIYQIQKNKDEIERLQTKLAERQHEEQLINNKVKIAQNTYDAFTRKHEELRVAESSQIAESNIIIISSAYPTTKPVAPKKAFNIVIGGALGLIASIILAFFLEFWESSGKQQE